MTQFWLATALFVLLGLTPVVLATVLNRRTAAPTPAPTRRDDQERTTP
jgi:hypothetical protein